MNVSIRTLTQADFSLQKVYNLGQGAPGIFRVVLLFILCNNAHSLHFLSLFHNLYVALLL